MSHAVVTNGPSKVVDIDTNLDESLFDLHLLEALNFSDSIAKAVTSDVNLLHPGINLETRPLCDADYDRGLMELLSQLTDVGRVEREQYKKRFREMKLSNGTYFIVVIEDCSTKRVIASGSLIIEMKFIHSCGKRGRIEDIVVNNEYRGRQLGKVLLVVLTLLAKELACYKVSLECKPELMSFYEGFGFRHSSEKFNYMQQRFDADS